MPWFVRIGAHLLVPGASLLDLPDNVCLIQQLLTCRFKAKRSYRRPDPGPSVVEYVDAPTSGFHEIGYRKAQFVASNIY